MLRKNTLRETIPDQVTYRKSLDSQTKHKDLNLIYVFIYIQLKNITPYTITFYVLCFNIVKRY